MLIQEKLEQIISIINKELKGSYLNRIECLSEFDYIFRFSRSKSKSIFISLNSKNPFVTLIDERYAFSSTSSFYQKIKFKLANSCLLNASTINNDNILCLEFSKINDTYDKLHYFLVFEIFKSNANLILLNEDKIEDAFRFRGIDTNHPILKNVKYLPPEKLNFSKEVKEKDEQYEKYYIQNLESLYVASKYKEVSLNIKRKIKSLNKKLEKIKEDQEEATKKLEYKNYGDHFLTIMDKVKRGDSYFDYYGEKIKINENYTPSQNLNQLFKIYKKAKQTLISSKDYIDKTEHEIDYLNSVFASLPYYNENDYQELIPELIEKKLLKNSNKKQVKNSKNAAKPYYLMHNGIKIGFGKNSLQNDNLTWKFATKNDYFLHTKNEHGNHVIIFSNELTDEILEFACEFCAFLTGHNDGEIIVAKCSIIKKGSEPGLVKLSSYESYLIKNLKYDFASLIKEAKRF